jgi:ribosome biogenesis protein Nip4
VRNLKEFLQGVHAKFDVKEIDFLKINAKRFYVNDELKKFIFNKDKLVYAGKYLGKMKKDFLPSAGVLDEISRQKANKIFVDKKTAWLFVCRRDIFEKNIEKIEGKFEENELFLVIYGDYCLGYGKVDFFEGDKILKNLFDIGDFLRRERIY